MDKHTQEMFSTAIKRQRLAQRNLMKKWQFPFNLMSECIDDEGNFKD